MERKVLQPLLLLDPWANQVNKVITYQYPIRQQQHRKPAGKRKHLPINYLDFSHAIFE